MVTLMLIGIPFAVLVVALVVILTAKGRLFLRWASVVILLLGIAGVGLGLSATGSQMDRRTREEFQVRATFDRRYAQLDTMMKDIERDVPIGIALCVGVCAIGIGGLVRAGHLSDPVSASSSRST